MKGFVFVSEALGDRVLHIEGAAVGAAEGKLARPDLAVKVMDRLRPFEARRRTNLRLTGNAMDLSDVEAILGDRFRA